MTIDLKDKEKIAGGNAAALLAIDS